MWTQTSPSCGRTISLHAYNIQQRLNTIATRISATCLFFIESDSFTTLFHTSYCHEGIGESPNLLSEPQNKWGVGKWEAGRVGGGEREGVWCFRLNTL